jgi:hypothetical protein
LAFWFGTLLALPRLRVLKWTHGLTPDELKHVQEVVDLDMEIYDLSAQVSNL